MSKWRSIRDDVVAGEESLLHFSAECRHTADIQERETLLKRSKRILGDGFCLLAELSEAGDNKTRRKGERSSTLCRRRNQVRQAQRTHRQRQQAYLSLLEKEIMRLRVYEESYCLLQDQVGKLNRKLAGGSSEPLSKPTREIELALDKDPSLIVLCPSSSSLSLVTEPSSNCQDRDSTSLALPLDTTSCGFQTNLPLQNPQVGIDFVLLLEWISIRLEQEPRGYPEISSSEFSSQALTACLNLWQKVQSDCLVEEESSVAIDQLLQCSQDLDLVADNITPVQVWDIIRSLPVLENITAETMGYFTAELCRHTKRQSSNAILDKSVVMSTLDKYLLRPTGRLYE